MLIPSAVYKELTASQRDLAPAVELASTPWLIFAAAEDPDRVQDLIDRAMPVIDEPPRPERFRPGPNGERAFGSCLAEGGLVAYRGTEPASAVNEAAEALGGKLTEPKRLS